MATWIHADDPIAQIELFPEVPTPNEEITFRLSGIWPGGCIPQSPKVSISSAAVRIETSNPQPFCTKAMTPWELTGSIGKLTIGNYQLIVTYSGPSVPATLEIGRKSFTVSSPSALNEYILPIVVNGAVADKQHYQTIFTVLNTATQDIRATVQVFSNAGTPAGVFCSPLAPPPSSQTAQLRPNAQYFQFTSADLPFLNGWARLSWEGPQALLASAEITLVAAQPMPCMLVCNWPSTEKLSSAQIPFIKPARDFRLPVTINRYRQTALALVNPSSADSITVKVSLLDGSGANAKLGAPDSFKMQIRPQERISKFLWQMVLEHVPEGVRVVIPETFQGAVILAADAPFAVGALNIMFPEGKFVSIPTLASLP